MTRVVQISDTHLSPTKAHFASNWPPLARWVTKQRPDLIIHTGDVTVDGADAEEDMRHCAELLAGLPGDGLEKAHGHLDLIVLGDRRGVDVEGGIVAVLREPVVLLVGVGFVADLAEGDGRTGQGR